MATKLEELMSAIGRGGETAFSAPWEARAFAMAVELSQAGVFGWDDFRRHLIREIGVADKVHAHGWVEPGAGYYTHFLRALEALLREKGIVDEAALVAAMAAITAAGAGDPHEH
jgi:nitrile hydratase accessory protein